MVTLDWHLLIVQALSFLITLWILKRFAWGPIQGVLTSRETEIRTDYEKADAARREMEDMRRQYQQRIEQADAEARARINASTQRAEQLKDEILAKAQQDAQALADRSRGEIERERQKVLAELRSQVTHLSVAIAGKIIDEHLDENRHRALVDDFISRLGTLA